MSIKKFFGSRKFRYGSVAIIFSVVFVALVLVLNIVLTVVGKKFSLYADLTKEEFYTVSAASDEQLGNIKTPVEIVFFQKREDIAEPSSGSPLGYVKYLAEQYEKKFDFIEVKYVDMLSRPAAANAYKKSTSDNIRNDSVVINCPSTGKKNIVQLKGFFTFDESGNLYGFNGEKRITSSILQVTNPGKFKAYFTTGHNEYLSGTIATLLVEQGYEVDIIDISTSDIPEDADLLIINQPSKDFAGIAAESSGAANEIEKIKNFVQKDYGDVILALPAVRADGTGTTPDLPELRELLEENFGITYTSSAILADSTANTIDNDGIMIVGQPCGETTSFEYQMHKAVTEKGIKIIAPFNLPLKITGGSDKHVVPVLTSSQDSFVQTADADNVISAPATPLVAVSSKIAYDENQKEKRGSLLVTGSLLFEYVNNSTYGNADFMYGVLKSFGNTSISVDIPTKPFKEEALDVTVKDANAMTVLITLIIPMVLLIAGIFVWYLRKRK